MQLGIGSEITFVYECVARDILLHIGSPEVDRNASRKQAIEDLFGKIVRLARVFVGNGEPVVLQCRVLGLLVRPDKGRVSICLESPADAETTVQEPQWKVQSRQSPGEQGLVPFGAYEVKIVGCVRFKPADCSNPLGVQFARMPGDHETVDEDTKFAFLKRYQRVIDLKSVWKMVENILPGSCFMQILLPCQHFSKELVQFRVIVIRAHNRGLSHDQVDTGVLHPKKSAKEAIDQSRVVKEEYVVKGGEVSHIQRCRMVPHLFEALLEVDGGVPPFIAHRRIALSEHAILVRKIVEIPETKFHGTMGFLGMCVKGGSLMQDTRESLNRFLPDAVIAFIWKR